MQNRLLPLIMLLASCSFKPEAIPPTNDFEDHPPDIPILVLSHGWHTGIVVPYKDLSEHLPQLKNRFDHPRYIEVGWGDKGFYQANEITTKITVKAIFWPSDTVMHVVAVDDPLRFFVASEKGYFCTNSSGYKRLLKFISNSFHQEFGANLISLKHGLYGNSEFYKAQGKYFLMNTCNKWTANALYSAGIDISPAFKLTADSIMDLLNESASGACITKIE